MEKIAIDLDKTLIDCDSFIYWIANKYFSDAISEKELHYCFVEENYVGNNGLISKLLARFSKMANSNSYKQIKNSISVVNSWYEKGIKIYILSSRPNFASLNLALKQFFVKSNLKYNGMVVNCNNKSKFCEKFDIDLLIDNSPLICLDANIRGIRSICLNNKINTDKFKNIIFADSWNSIDNIVKFENYGVDDFKLIPNKVRV